MHDSVKNFYVDQNIEKYERSHSKRLDFLVQDLKLDLIKNSSIADFGCGYAPIFRRLPKNNSNIFYGFDGASGNNSASEVCHFIISDLNLPFADDFLSKNSQVDVAFSFETLEHLSNPYNYLIEIKKILKRDGLLYLTIPHINTTHNTLYPGLLYPVENFVVFLRQMAFEIIHYTTHDKNFYQNVFVLRNKDWSFSQMAFYKLEEKFRNIEPITAINL